MKKPRIQAWRLFERFIIAAERFLFSIPQTRKLAKSFSGAKAIAANSYHFQRQVIKLDYSTSNLITEKDELIDAPSYNYGLFIHEFIHYIQSMTTVLGNQIQLNWISTIIEITPYLESINPIPASWFYNNRISWKAPKPAAMALKNYLNESNSLIGTKYPLRPTAETKNIAPYSTYSFQLDYSIQNNWSGLALALPTSNTGVIGIPLLGDVFFEGGAQAIQWIAEKPLESLDEMLRRRPIDPNPNSKIHYGYYIAIIRFVKDKLPDWDPLHTTALICDIALCSNMPGSVFTLIVDELSKRKAPSSITQYLDIRRELDALPLVAQGKDYIKDKLESVLEQCNSKASDFMQEYIMTLLNSMSRSWKARLTDPAYFLDMEYRNPFIKKAVEAAGCPPIFFKDNIDNFIRLTGDESLLRASYWLRGCYELIETIACYGQKGPCPLLKTRICNFKGKNKYCRENLLNAPIVDGQACHIANAATSLGIYGRQIK